MDIFYPYGYTMWIENIHSYFYNNPNTIQSQTQSIDKTAGCIKK